MVQLARLSINRPRAALLGWGALALALSVIGLGVAHSLTPSIVVVPGTESSRAQQLIDARFGPTQLVPILLQGPRGKLETQGPRLVRALVKRAHTRALSAWDAGSISRALRPSATAAMIVVSVDRPEKSVVNEDQPQIEALVKRDIATPVRASVTGQPSIDRALKNEALTNAKRSELIALAVLFVLLLLALRAPLAAALVTGIGAATVLASYGLMTLLGKLIAVDPVAVALASISGLTLGVGYSLLILDRFHRQEPAHASRRETMLAASTAVATSGGAVLVAGTGLILALVLATVIAPTQILVSLGIGVLICSALAIGGAVAVMPAALVLFAAAVANAHVDAPTALVRDWDRLVGAGAWVRHRAALAGALATAALLALAAPALSLRTGPPGVGQLPAGDPARKAFEAVARAMGPGWPTPYNIIVANPHGPITTAATLAKLDQLQARIARDRAVASVTGPGALSAQTKPLGTLPKQLKESSKLLTGGKGDLQRLVNGLGQAGAGAKQLQSGLRSATHGAGELHAGSGSAQAGAGQLHAGLSAASSGSQQLEHGLSQALAGAGALKKGATEALAGSIELTNGIGSVHTPVAASLPSLEQLAGLTASTSQTLGAMQSQAQGAAGDTNAAIQALRAVSASDQSDPHYGEAIAALERASGDLGGLTSGLSGALGGAQSAATLAGNALTTGSFLTSALQQLRAGAGKLQAGLGKLRHGNIELSAGIRKLSGGGGELATGLSELRGGAGALETGLGQLTGGAAELESGLAGGVSPTGRLVSGLGVMQASVAKFRGQLPSPKGLEELETQSPGLFNSGYFLLAAIAGAQPASRNEAGFAVNVARGGDAGQIVVVSRYQASAAKTAALGERLDTLGRRFASANKLEVAIGGPAGNLENFTSATNARLPWVIVALAIALTLVLGVAMRAVLIALVAVLFNLLTAAATFGVMKLLFVGPHPPLGGPGYLDPMSIIGIFTAIFGISLVFLVVLLARTREELQAGASVDGALDLALQATAAASTGAGLLMVAATIPFATSGLLTVREVGVGIAVAVALDAFLVRPVLLPAAVEVLGRLAWWPTHIPRRQLRIPMPQGTLISTEEPAPRVGSVDNTHAERVSSDASLTTEETP